MGTREVPVATDPSDIPDELFAAARRRALDLALRPSASAATIAGALDWLREHPAELAQLLGWGHDFEFSAFYGDAASVRRVLTGPWERA
jgi:hypothetical protein